MSTKLEDLASDVRFHAASFIAALLTAGIPHVVTCTLRTQAEQAAYYAQGRQALDVVNNLRSAAGLPALAARDNTYTITMCNGTTTPSPHQSGRALDVVPANDAGNPIWPDANDPRWEEIAVHGKEAGFEWGGDWTSFPDRPHYQMA